MIKKYNISYLNLIKTTLKKEKVSYKIKKSKKKLKVRVFTSRIKTSFTLKKIYLYDKNLWYIQKKNILLYKNFYQINSLTILENNANLIKAKDYE